MDRSSYANTQRSLMAGYALYFVVLIGFFYLNGHGPVYSGSLLILGLAGVFVAPTWLAKKLNSYESRAQQLVAAHTGSSAVSFWIGIPGPEIDGARALLGPELFDAIGPPQRKKWIEQKFVLTFSAGRLYGWSPKRDRLVRLTDRLDSSSSTEVFVQKIKRSWIKFAGLEISSGPNSFRAMTLAADELAEHLRSLREERAVGREAE